MSDHPKPFVRTCPKCGLLCQTADQTAKTPCDACSEPKVEAKALPVAPPASPPSDLAVMLPAPADKPSK